MVQEWFKIRSGVQLSGPNWIWNLASIDIGLKPGEGDTTILW